MPGVVAVVQARLGSTRLPGKVMADLGRDTVLGRLMRSLEFASGVDEVILAIPASDGALADLAAERGWSCVRGSEDDVLQRYVDAGRATGASTVVRLTADCPLLDPGIVDDVVVQQRDDPVDYRIVEGYPRGVGDVEVVTMDALLTAARDASDPWDREHVTAYVRDRPRQFDVRVVNAPAELWRPELRVCVDEAPDLRAVRALLDELGDPATPVSAAEIVAALDRRPDVVAMNAHVQQRS